MPLAATNGALAALRSRLRALVKSQRRFTVQVADLPTGALQFHVAVCVQGTGLCARRSRTVLVSSDMTVEFEGAVHLPRPGAERWGMGTLKSFFSAKTRKRYYHIHASIPLSPSRDVHAVVVGHVPPPPRRRCPSPPPNTPPPPISPRTLRVFEDRWRLIRSGTDSDRPPQGMGL